MFRLRKAAVMAASRKKLQSSKLNRKLRRRKKSESRDSRAVTECIGLAISLGERKLNDARPPARRGCSSRCRHAAHLKDNLLCPSQGKADEWISEDMYKHFTETDSRPLTPENYSRRSVTLPRSSSMTLEKVRKCVTPEPDAKQCQFHNRRVLILDLRRVKSVDAITRQNSVTTGESVDSTYGDFDYDNRSSSVNRDSSSIFHHSTPRNFSVSRSTSPKGSRVKGRVKKKDRSGSPVAYERSSSPKILEGLTLPPLHQSVLTLLKQKSGVKPSPRSMITEHGAALDSGSASKAKKLRRHGRKKKAKDDGKESEEKELEKPEPPDGREGRGDEELQETQLSTLQNQLGLDSDYEGENEDNFVKSPSYMNKIKSLRDVLDGHLRKEQWSQKEMENLNEEIEKLSEGLKRHHTDFKAKSISIKEDTWLAFPRTCTRVSATFGVPWNSKHLRVDYLRKYVMITESRQHLYNLIYQRYRMLENPMGKTITFKSVQRALTEVLGRQFTDDELVELQHSYLNVENTYDLDQKAFAGICAFCERIFGKYELENCKECAHCSRTKMTDKQRCHVKRKNELEEMDLSYLSSKIKLGEASPTLRRLIVGLTDMKLDEEGS